MWRDADLAFSPEFTAPSCSVVAAHPWVYGLGQQTENGAYLSPLNAVSWLAEKLASVSGETDVVIFMATGNGHDDFMAKLDALAAVFPAPAFTQVSRLARSAAELATVKMQKPAKAVNGLPAPMPLSVPTGRSVASASAVAGAASGGFSMEELKAGLASFAAQRTQLLADISAGLDDLTGKSARTWVFTGRGTGPTLIRQLLDGVPQLSAVFTAAIMLAGDNLEGIRGMIHECDNAGA